jgi:hypothetical protein
MLCHQILTESAEQLEGNSPQIESGIGQYINGADASLLASVGSSAMA